MSKKKKNKSLKNKSKQTEKYLKDSFKKAQGEGKK